MKDVRYGSRRPVVAEGRQGEASELRQLLWCKDTIGSYTAKTKQASATNRTCQRCDGVDETSICVLQRTGLAEGAMERARRPLEKDADAEKNTELLRLESGMTNVESALQKGRALDSAGAEFAPLQAARWRKQTRRRRADNRQAIRPRLRWAKCRHQEGAPPSEQSRLSCR